MNNNEVTREQQCAFIDRAYSCSCAHGFHEHELSVSHCLMLVLTEVSEMVEADRVGSHADLTSFDKWQSAHGVNYFNTDFTQFIKDTVEDEMADVCIRLYDLCGCFGLRDDIEWTDTSSMREDFDELFKDLSLCERCFTLCAILCRCESADACKDNVMLRQLLLEAIPSAVCFMFCMADDMGIDLMRHIELKMQYNESRVVRHGKKY